MAPIQQTSVRKVYFSFGMTNLRWISLYSVSQFVSSAFRAKPKSRTLTEQTIGRGLRLPYGERTRVDEVDRLSIVSHDKYEAIINLANDPESLVRKVYYIDDAEPQTEGPKETVEMDYFGSNWIYCIFDCV